MKLCAESKEDYSDQFEALLRSEPYKSVHGIVYRFQVKQPIPRVVGESNILYIGRTEKSFSERYYPSKAFNLEMDFFDRFYKHAIERYGSISVEVTQVQDTKHTEWKALADYFADHLEYPPLNRSIPTRPT